MLTQSKSKFETFIEHNAASLFVFVLWPFLGFIIAIRNYDQKLSKYVVLMFFAFYGLLIVNDTVGADLYTNYIRFKQYSLEPNSYFWVLINGLFKEDGTLDLLQKLIMFFVSRITSNVNILYLVYSCIFGYVYLKGIDLLHDFYKNHKNINSWLMLVMFVLIIPITSIGNFRFFSAVWIFFVGAYNVIYFKNNKFLIIAFLSAFMHFGLIAANLLLVIYLLLGNRNKLYLILIAFSFLIPNIAGDFIVSIANNFGGGFEDKANEYLSPDSFEILANKRLSWFLTLRPKLILYYIYLMYIVSYFYWPKQKNEGLNNIFSFSLLFFSFSNFVIAVPSLGGRYLGIFELFAFSYLCFAMFYRYQNYNKLSVYSYLALIPLLLHFFVTFRTSSETINIWLFTPNPLPFIFDPVAVWTIIEG